MRALVAAAIALAGASGCKATGVFRCDDSAQCRLGAEIGVCEPEGYCSFADPDCESNRRFDELAGDGLAGLCVDPDRDAGVDAGSGGCVARLEVGPEAMCAIRAAGELECWGGNGQGELTGDLGDPQTTAAAVTIAPVAESAIGGGHSCVRLSGGELRCVGANAAGQLGDDSITPSSTFVTPEVIAEVAGIAAGAAFSCARDSDGDRARCWGSNGEGQIGDGTGPTVTPTLVPTQVVKLAGGDLTGVDEIAAGDDFACARAGGEVFCWGANSRGQLGDGATSPRPSAVSNGLTGVVEIAAGSAHACARTAAGEVLCWGDNDRSQLGNGSGDGFETSPATVVGVPPATALAIGADHSCALAGTAVWCWGDNERGQIADPAGAEISDATPITDLGEPVALAAGGDNTCAILDDAVLCRGANSEAQLGLGSSDGDPHAPGEVLGLSCD